MLFKQKRTYRMLCAVFVVIVLWGMVSISWAQDSPWTEKAPMPTARGWFSTSVVDGKIYAIGGGGSEPEGWPAYSAMEEYDPATDTWTTKTPMPTARACHSASVVDGKIYAIGGEGWTILLGEPAFSTVEEYDPMTDTWTPRADMPTARTFLSTSMVHGKIYAIGGVSRFVGTSEDQPLTTVEEYDPATDTWTPRADMPTARMIARTCAVHGRIYVMGGCLQGWIDVTTVEEYDPLTDTWTPKADMPSIRRCFSASVVDGKIYAIGGVDYGDKRYLTTMEEYDPLTDTWTPKADMPTARWNLSTSVVNGRIYAIGGASKVGRDPQRVLSIVEEYDPGVETSIQTLFWGALKATFR